MLKKFLFIIGCVVIAIALVSYFTKTSIAPLTDSTLKTGVVTLHGERITVEIADTPASQMKGLAGRTSLAKDRGMIFPFSERRIETFWMKGMLIPLDFIWIDGEKVIGVTENAPADDGLILYGSPGPVTAVFEINAGEVAKFQIKKDDVVELIVTGTIVD